MHYKNFHKFFCQSFQQTISFRKYHKDVRVRFAPSPTGFLHLGGLRTAFYNFLYARKSGGKFILRIEDTDQKRIVPGSCENLNSMLDWTGLNPDESPFVGGPYGPYVQSQRLEKYKEGAEYLLKAGYAYKCFCSETRLELMRKEAMRNRQNPGYDNKCRHLSNDEVKQFESEHKPFTIRFKIKAQPLSFTDIIFGDYTMDISEYEGDFIIIKSDSYPTYHFACIIDDHLMEISHVLRGAEWLASTPKHLMLHEAFGWEAPRFAHLPLLVNSDRTKLSKRQGAIGVEYFKDQGYSPEALLNFLSSAGGGFEKEDNFDVHNLNTLSSMFNLENVTTHSCVLDLKKIEIYNHNHLSNVLSSEQSTAALLIKFRKLLKEKFGQRYEDEKENLPDNYVKKILTLYKERLNNLYELLSTDMQYLWASPDVNELFQHLENLKITEPQKGLTIVSSYLSSVSGKDFSEADLLKGLRDLCKKNKLPFASFMTMLRIVLTGQKDGPGVSEILAMLGPKRSLEKINFILEKIEQVESN